MQVALENKNRRNAIHPMKLALWMSLASISMMFAGLLSAYIVRQAAGNWFEFTLPNLFLASTAVIIFSSSTLHRSLLAFRQKKEWQYKLTLLLSFFLGIAFVICQYQGWSAMLAGGIDIKGNPSGSFIYVITGLHVAHVLGGLAAMVVALIHAFTLNFRVTPLRINRLEMTAHYWHYVDVLWIVLFLFLTFYR